MNRKTLLVTLSVVILLLSTFSFGAIPSKEREALIALYNSTNGDNWNDNSGWKSPPLHSDGFAMPGTEATWYGISISEGYVEHIRLGNNNLSNIIPKKLGNLKNLNYLQLYENQLTGSIPSELGNLSNLEILALYSNQLTGNIPTELGNLSNLYYLLLHSNQLTGSIPSELGNLNNLEILALFNNQLTGSIPPAIGNLSKLFSLQLDSNQLTGSISSELGNLSNLTNLALNSNQLTGSIPSELGNLSKLHYLYLNSNQLIGNIPTEIGNLSMLHHLYLNSNKLIGNIPASLTNLNNLSTSYTDIDYNGLYTNDESLRTFLNNKDMYWEYTQTIAPSDVSATALSSSSIRVSFTPIKYSYNSGGYKIYYSTTSSGPWSYSGMTPDKHTTSYDVSGLNAGTKYYFVVKTQTDSHSMNVNTIISEYSEVVSTTTNVGLPSILLNRNQLNFGADSSGLVTPPQYFLIENSGTGMLNWSVSESQDWIICTPISGTDSGIVSVSVDASELPEGTYIGSVTVSDPNAVNLSQTIGVNLIVYSFGANSDPFGNFSTPEDESTVRSSIPVTGWVLDEIGVESVKIYRGNPGDLTYIGDAVFAEGARPDVEQSYPGYPMNYKAGWGYMMLTNFLPDGGNGTFKIHAIATDVEGHQMTLGTKTIICDNANAVKPFGAIDTPTQGGEASGDSFRNGGWVLTPPPNSIPTDGSSINVFVDGVDLGHPTYNVYRSDIATFFPGYANSDGAYAYFDFDTTAYENGIHSIYWTAEDSAGNADGIGSRYFTIQNTGNSRSKKSGAKYQRYAKEKEPYTFSQIALIPVNDLEPIKAKKNSRKNSGYKPINPDEEGTFNIKIKELERIVIELSNESSVVSGYTIIGDELRPFPIGSTLDTRKGIFYWQPGPGFLGEYRFVFIEKMPNGEMRRKNVIVTIEPKFARIVNISQ